MPLALPPSPLTAATVRTWPPDRKAAWLAGLDDADAQLVLYHWPFWARPDQLAPTGDWSTWLICGGRGSGKTRTACQWDIERAKEGGHVRMALMAPTAADCRDVIVEGESGLLACSPPDFMPVYHPSKRMVLWPNGARGFLYSAEEPDRLRGPQHHFGHAEEACAWKGGAAWDMFQFGLRLGKAPKAVVATTPKPVKLIRDLLKDRYTVVSKATTYANLAYLAPTFRRTILEKYEGTRLGRQELNAELLDDVPGALLERLVFDADPVPEPPPMVKIVVGIDPAVTSGEASANTGIVAGGLGEDRTIYVIEDASVHAKPLAWATRAVELAVELEADLIVAEVNNGGDLVQAMLDTVWAKRERDARDAGERPALRIPYKAVHAARGKRTRAEPVAGLYQQGRVRHCQRMPHLEDEWCTWDPLSGSPSPDRLDAACWMVSELMAGMSRAVRAPVDLSRQPARRPKGPLE